MCGKLDMISAGRISQVGLAEDKMTTSATNIIGFLQPGGEAAAALADVSDAMLARTAFLTFSLFSLLNAL
jgi:hypothetical protein